MRPIAISKTKLLSFLQCPRRLWLSQYSPELEDDRAIDHAAIETGHVVGAKAREVYGQGSGRLVNHDRGLRNAIAETEALLLTQDRAPLFEATFDYQGLTVQVDVLDRSGAAPRIFEVKAATKPDDHHLSDCAIQVWTLRQLDVPVAGASLALIDSSFVYQGEGDYRGLFHEIDMTADVDAMLATVPAIVDGARATLASLDEPTREIGAHCTKPYSCPFFAHCAGPQGEYPVLDLGGRKDALYALMREGFSDLRELKVDQLKNAAQQRIWQQTVAGEPWLDPALESAIAALGFPRYFLDFETIAFAIPIWAGTRPYEPLPFQWSCHIDDGRGPLRHAEFLDVSGTPPMRAAAESLIATLGREGPIVVYSGYEQRMLGGLAARYPDLEPQLSAIGARLVDLLPLAKAHYYHPDMHGSWSIKAVLPTIGAGVDYSSLSEVQDGEAAQAAYLEAIHEDTADARRSELRAALLAYCRLDTEALVRLVAFFGRRS
jgi:predicted RecB family nuclease